MTEAYIPTAAERAQSKMTPDAFKVSGDTVFSTLQGEGITAGMPSVFFRLNECNLACGFTGGWQCDTGYTWNRERAEYWQEPENWPIDYAAKQIEEAWEAGFPQNDGRRLVITGGEPLIQQRKIVELLDKLADWQIEIETNGTIMPLPELSDCQFNCSPKLENSGNSKKRRYKPDVLKYINGLPKSQFKFVAVTPDDFGEIDEIARECELASGKILIMPEGNTAAIVQQHADGLTEEVTKRGWSLAMRNQLIWYGPKRKT